MPLWWVHDFIFAASASAGQRDAPRIPRISTETNLLHMRISPAQWELLARTPVEAIRWSTRAIHALECEHCRNLGDVFSVPKEVWGERRYVGKKTSAEIAKRILSFLKIRRILPQPCDTTAIEQGFQSNQIQAALAEAFKMCGLTARQIRVLELRYGLMNQPPLTLLECARTLARTRQDIFQLESHGKLKLSRHREVLRAVHNGLNAIQGHLWHRMAGQGKLIIPKETALHDLHRKLGGPESLMVKICHGDARKWLNKNLTSTAEGWLIPV